MTTATPQRLTTEAQRRLDDYLRQVRAALSGCPSVNAQEVERDIREHIDSELPVESDTVSVRALDAILERLGSPNQWVPQEEISWVRRFLLRLRTGPEDWRLAYLAFSLLVVGLFVPQFILASYLASRASLAVTRQRNEDIGAQKWFIYPTLLAANIVLLVVVLFGPLLVAAGGGNALHDYLSEGRGRQPPDFAFLPRNRFEFVAGFTASVAAIWWMLLGFVLYHWPRLVQVVLAGPIGDGFSRKHAKVLMYMGLGLGILWGVAASRFLWQ